MEAIKEIFSTGNLIGLCTFIARPLLLFVVCKIVIKILMKLSAKILEKSNLDKGIRGFTKSAIRIALWSIAIVIIADSVGINTASLVTILGVVSLALSLSLQNLMTNAFSGITILISKPFSVGDYVEVAGVGGTVKSISLMRTTLVTPDRKIQMIPNGDVCAQNITNYSLEPVRRVEIKVSASYKASTEKVQEAIFEVLLNDNRIKRNDENLPTVRLSAYNSNDIEYTVRMWVDNKEYWNVYYDVLENIRESFAKHKIEFSYPHIVVHKED
jgi:small conductance mechanosensitive channel